MAVPHERSEDNWIRVIDGEVRGSFYKPTDDKAHEAIGGIAQSVGESAIANTALPNLMSAGESRLLRKFTAALCRCLCFRGIFC